MNDLIIIGSHAGGLGDHLLYSTLPELYARQGHRVIIQATGMRNPEIAQLLWAHNPFVSEVSPLAQTCNAGAAMFDGYSIIRETKKHGPIRAVERLHSFMEDTGNRYPHIYYKPRFIPEASDDVLADPTSISQGMAGHVFDEHVRWLGRWHEFDPAKVIVLRSKYQGSNGRDALAGNQEYVTRSIFEYADLIFSCRRFIAAESGGAVLASAIKADRRFPLVHSLHTTMSINDELFQFPNVKYAVTGVMTPDHHGGYPE